MKKIDHKKTLKHLYLPSAKEVGLVEVPPMNFLTIDGEGDPNTSQAYAEAVEALFSVSYAVKFSIKRGPMKIDYAVMPLEGLWWTDDISAFSTADKSNWKWTAMVMQPEWVTKSIVDQAAADVAKKKNLHAVSRMQYIQFAEGTAAQILHIGPFSEEGPTIEKVHRFIESRGVLAGKHHEIYLSDIRKAAPEKWKTVIRQPFTLNK